MSNNKNVGVRKVVLVSFMTVSMLAFVVAPALSVLAQEVSPEVTVEVIPELTLEVTPEVSTEPSVEPTIDEEAAVDVAEITPEPSIEPTPESTPEVSGSSIEEVIESTPVTSPILTTDKEDYHPGETANIFGSFFAPFQNFVLRIFGNSEVGDFYTDQSYEVSSNDSGYFSFNYVLDNFYRPLYNVIVTTFSSEEVAQTTFTDAPNASVDTFSQCANDDGDGYAPGGCNWTNGNLNASNSVYQEEDATVQRLLLTGLGNGSHVVTIEYDTTKGGKHAYDFLTDPGLSESWVTASDYCEGLTAFPSCTSATVNFSPNITHDPLNVSGTVDTNQNFEIRNGTITSVSTPTLINGTYAGDSTTRVNVTLSVNTATCLNGSGSGANAECPVLITWGAHISSQADWGSGTSAVNISGSPYHVRVTALDGKATGNRDNQMSASVIPGTIIINKDTVPNDGQDFSFTTTGTGLSNFSLDDDADGTLPNTRTFVVDEGSYSVTEGVFSGYSVTINCTDPTSNTTVNNANRVANINVVAGETVTCTFVNTLQQGTLTLVKTVTNNNGGTATTTDFQAKINGNNVPWGVAQSLNAGNYTASEVANVSGYSAGAWGGDCAADGTVVLAAGQDKTCTITNDDIAPTLTLVKNVINDNGGTATTTDFQGKIDGNNATWTVAVPLSVGLHTATEVANVSGYTAGNWGQDCLADGSIFLSLGQNATCTITNNDQSGTLIVKKIVINDNGGQLEADDFSFQVNGGSVVSFEADGQNDLTVNAGTYSVVEPTVSGYATSYDNCSNVVIPNGGTQTCTVTNNDNAPSLTLIKQVVNDNGGTATAADWTLTAAGYDSGSPDAGTYNLSESNGPAGYTQTSLTCSNAQGQVTSVTLGLGEQVTCTFVNDDNAPSLTLVKQVINDNGGTAVATDWTLTAAGYDSGSPDAGTYNLSESGPSGYTQTSLTCSDSGATQVTSVTLSLGENVTCTFVNDDNAPSLRLVKVVTNNNGGGATAADWTLTASGPTGFNGVGPAVNNGVSFDAGTYDLSEAGPSGYSASDWVCVGGNQNDADTITLGLGESATCTITNDDIQPRLIVIKHVVNDNGGTAEADDFSMLINFASNVSPAGQFPGQEAPGTLVTLDAGPYGVAESVVAGYQPTFGTDCAGNIAIGETKTCTVTNDDVAPRLTLVKNVVNDDGGDAVVADFPLFINGNSVTSGVANNLTANILYTATETNLDGYAPSVWGGDCASDGTITLQPGDNKTCTITNDDIPARITLIKVVTNNNGGTADPDDFDLTIGGNAVLSGVTIPVGSNTPHALNETLVDGYSFVSLTGDAKCPSVLGGTVTLNEGEAVSCTITNDDIAPKLHLRKVVVNDNNGPASIASFTLTANGAGANDLSGASPVDSDGTLQADTFALSETSVPGYSASDWVCVGGTQNGASITVGIGGEATCTITNDDQSGHLIVKKVTLPADNETVFSITLDDSALNGSSTRDLSTVNQVDYEVNAGTYSVSEAGEAGWDETGNTCIDVEVLNGATETCTITNTQRGHIIIEKNAIPDGSQEFTFNNNFENNNPAVFGLVDDATVGLPSYDAEVLPGTYEVSENLPVGWKLDDVNCSDGSPVNAIVVAPGETVTCTFTNEKLATIVVVKNTLGGNGQFDFTTSGEGLNNFSLTTVDGTAQTTFENVDPDGTYSVTENVPAGWDLLNAECSGTNNPEDITPNAGEVVTCTFTNEADSNIIVKKETDPDGNGQVFSFNVSYDVDGFSLSDGQSNDSGDIDPGTYSVSENTPVGWDLESVVCSDGSDPSDIDLEAGETVTCTFTNEKDAFIIVEKQTVGDVAGSFEFDSSWSNNFSLSDGQQDNSGDLDPGAYSVSELTPAGWYLTDVSCVSSDQNNETAENISLQAGETVTCTFTNVKIEDLQVEKDADTTYTRTFNWTIEKTVDQDTLNLFTGDNDAVDYTVKVTKDDGVDSAWAVSGTITITNPNSDSDLSATVSGVSDVVTNSGPMAVVCPTPFPFVIPAGQFVTCSYSGSLNDGANDVNTATVSTTGLVPGDSGTADVVFGDPTTLVNDSVDVNDTNGESWTFDDDDSETYEKTFTCGGENGYTGTGNVYKNTATIDIVDGDSDDADVTVNCYDLTVTKTAVTSFTRTWDWTIEKVGNQTELTLAPGQAYPVEYDVTVDADSADSDHKVTGQITITNPAPIPATLADVVDELSVDGSATVDCGLVTVVPVEDSIECTYEKTLSGANNQTNTATVTLSNGTEYSGNADVTFATTPTVETDECVNIVDDGGTPGDTSDDINHGQVCSGDVSKTFEYTLNVGPYDDQSMCNTNQLFVNIATLTTGDSETVISDGHTVNVRVQCVCSLTQGYWKTHNDAFHGGAPTDDNWLNVNLLANTVSAENTGFFTTTNSFPALGPNLYGSGTTAFTWYNVFWTAPKGNVYYNLAHQYMATKLNVLNGAWNPTIGASLAEAEALFQTHTPAAIATMKGKNATLISKKFNELAGIFGAFNEGTTNPAGHCSEIPVN